jgi:hypothetical protein
MRLTNGGVCKLAGLVWMALYALGLLGYILSEYLRADDYSAFRERMGEAFDTSNITLYVVLFLLFLPGIALFKVGHSMLDRGR